MVLHTEDVIAPGVPSPSLMVIGAGFGRTGTLSLREALVRLGFGPCDHMLENFEHPDRFALWQEPSGASRPVSRSTGGRCSAATAQLSTGRVRTSGES